MINTYCYFICFLHQTLVDPINLLYNQSYIHTQKSSLKLIIFFLIRPIFVEFYMTEPNSMIDRQNKLQQNIDILALRVHSFEYLFIIKLRFFKTLTNINSKWLSKIRSDDIPLIPSSLILFTVVNIISLNIYINIVDTEWY